MQVTVTRDSSGLHTEANFSRELDAALNSIREQQTTTRLTVIESKDLQLNGDQQPNSAAVYQGTPESPRLHRVGA
jgi:hypothetical protein